MKLQTQNSDESQMVVDHSRVLARAAFAAGTGNAIDAADGIIATLGSALRFDAASVFLWDCCQNRHRVAAQTGYAPSTLAKLSSIYSAQPADRMLSSHDGVLPMDDLPYDFLDTDFFLEVLEPAGFEDGMAVCMFADDGQYTGMLGFSSCVDQSFAADDRALISALAPAVAPAFDCRDHSLPAHHVPTGWRAALIDSSGEAWPVSGSDPCTAMEAEGFLELIRRLLDAAYPRPHTGLIIQAGLQLEVGLQPVADPIHHGDVCWLLTERDSEIPYGLSLREYDVLNALALGHSNDQIALDRSISVRTVTSHVERILKKTQATSRAGAALLAMRDGRLLLGYELSEAPVLPG